MKFYYVLMKVGCLARMNGISKETMKAFFKDHPELCQARRGEADERWIIMSGYNQKKNDWPKTVGENMELRNETTEEVFEGIKKDQYGLGDKYPAILKLLEQIRYFSEKRHEPV